MRSSMRNNQPITQTEFDVPNNQILVSKTDLEGKIIEINSAFELVSGFTRDDLIGSDHNIVRHPDVPQAIFADMWQELKNGRPWTQFVKNRRKNGDFYWVKARATPVFENDRIVGYMSVRTVASQAEKAQAQSDYQAIASGKASIKHGRVHRGFRWPKFNPFDQFSPEWLLISLTGIFAVLPAVFMTYFEQGISAETILALSIGLLLIAGFYGRFIRTQLQENIDNLNLITHQKSPKNKDYDPTTLFGKLINIQRSLYLTTLEKQEENAHRLDQSQQLRDAMDRMQSNIMTIDADFNIVYMNNNMQSFLVAREAKLRNVLPDLDVTKAMGANIDIFHKNPMHQRHIVNSLTETNIAQIEIAGIHFELAMIPVFDRSGIRTSTLVEWKDLSEEVQLLDNVHQVVQEAKNGHLSKQIQLSEVDGIAKDLSTSINELLQSINSAVSEVVLVTTAMAKGDLTQTINNQYEGELGELKNSVNNSLSRVNSVVYSASNAAEVVDNTSSGVYKTSTDLADRIQQQAAAVEETSATMNQMNETIQNNTENANRASYVAQEVQTKASEGSEVMEQTIQAMSEIQESSQKISEIVTMIDSIAFQTNLLALNAAVEAARAGDHGRGFAVVAGEVRSLAQKSADAAKEITQLIDESVHRINHGTELASKSGDYLNTIVGSVDEMTQMMTGIAKASNEQAEGISQVNIAITEIDQSTQKNSSVIEQTTYASKELSRQAELLSDEMDYFKTNQTQHKQVEISN